MILPQNGGVGHVSRTDENIRPGQLDTYSHVVPSMQEDAARKLDSLLG